MIVTIRVQGTTGPYTQQRERYPFEPVLEVLTARHGVLSNGEIAEQLGINRRSVIRLRHGQTHGLGSVTADRVAQALGLHPAELWDDWMSEQLPPEGERRSARLRAMRRLACLYVEDFERLLELELERVA